ncbi:hypothetical protein AB0K52_25100 [Glycomyces sp. NPDC049804]|uniref:phage tail protein n=1 Tax=Glycomyces sp. NPDC049804 TaxID=3154363 RepID=UPI0034293C07
MTVANGTLRATAERTRSAPAAARKPHPRPAKPATGGAGQLLWLQAAAGNAAVSKMINAKKSEAPQLDAQSNAQPATAVQRDAGSCPPPPVAPPGVTAAQDPKFQQVKKDVARKGKAAKAHPNAQHEAGEAQAAAEPPADDREAQSKAAHTAEMAQAKPAGFDKAAFIAAVTEAIAAQRPQTNEEATEFASSGKAGEIKNQVSGMVTEGKDKSGKEIADSSKKAPDPGAAVEKPVTPMTPPKPAPDLKPPDGKKAIPDKAPAEQTELGSTKCELNEKMAGAGVTETQLKNSNEPELMGAADAKGKAEEHAATAPAQMRADEQAQLASNVAGAQAAGAAGVTGMVGDNARAIGRAGANKNAAKSRDERERARISGEIKRIFDTTKTEVDGILGGIDAKVDTLFTAGEAKARAVFEADHQRRMREYEDAQDLVTWIADKFRPTRPEVLQIFTDAAKTYEREMQKVISNIADVIGAELDKATARIQLGRDQVARFVAEQPRELQNIAQEAAGEMGDQFESLDASVTEKSSALAEDLASKYAEARAGVDARVQELQAEHRSWRDQAVDAVEGAIDTITKLKDMLLGVLARAAGAIDKIIADPIGFLGNLVTAVKNGVMAFGANIATHLQAGLKAWLLGSLSSAGIEIPEEFDVKGILKMVLSILGLTWPAIRARIVRFIPEPVMARLEQMVEVVQILVTEGVPGLWRWIVEKLGDLKEMVLGQIKEFVVSKIIQAGIVWIISMLNPAAAFIKACQAIYNIVMFFVNQASQIKEFVDAVLDGIDSIASGGGGAVSALIEGALVKALPMVIGFMASLLGLGGISEKIRGILQKVQEPVGKVIDKIIGTIVKIGKGLLRGLRRGGAAVADAARRLRDAVWARLTKSWSVSMKGAGHQVTLEKQGGTGKVMMASRKEELLAKITRARRDPAVAANGRARKKMNRVETEVRRLERLVEIFEREDPDARKANQYRREVEQYSSEMLSALAELGRELDLDALSGGEYVMDGKVHPRYRGKIRETFYGPYAAYSSHKSAKHADARREKRRRYPDPLVHADKFWCPGWAPANRLPHLAPDDDFTLDHTDSAADHWTNKNGNDTTQAVREAFYKNGTNIQGMCGDCNSAKGSGGVPFTENVGENFTGPGGLR